MTRLLNLPDELILVIVNCLQAGKEQTSLPFYKWGDAYRSALERERPQRIKDLRSFCLVSRRFYNLLKPTFYQEICVREKTFRCHPLDQLKRILKNDPALENSIVSAILPCENSIYDVCHFFFIPNIQALSIRRFNDWEPLEFEGDRPVGKSPITTLNLIGCGAHEEALAAVLSWPAALEVLHYDVEQVEWEGPYGDEPAESWTCGAFVRALQPQKKTLKELTLTRPWLDHEGLFNGPRIDLRCFTALITLRIYQVFLCGVDDPLEAWRSLPHSLEELEIFYDDWDLTRFDEDEFLRGLLVHKEEHLPNLRKVSINSPEETWDNEKQEFKPAGPWTPPSPLTRAFETAGMVLDVWLGPIEFPKLDGLDIFSLHDQPRKRR